MRSRLLRSLLSWNKRGDFPLLFFFHVTQVTWRFEALIWGGGSVYFHITDWRSGLPRKFR